MDSAYPTFRPPGSMLDLARVDSHKGWEDEDLVLDLMRKIEDQKETYNYEVEDQAELNSAWYAGYQELYYNADSRRLMLQPNPFHRPRITLNLMRGMVDGVVAKLGLDPIRMAARPGSEDISDFDTAELQTSVLRYYERLLNIPALEDEMDLAACLSGEVICKVVWDPYRGSEFDVKPEDVDMDPEKFQKEYGKELLKLRVGDIAVSPASAFNIFWGPYGVSFDDKDYLYEGVERSKSYVLEHYDKVNPEDLEDVYDEKAKVRYRGQLNRWGQLDKTGDREKVSVRTLWVKPHKRLKGLEGGRHIVAVQNKILHNGPIPYDHQQIPYVRFPFMIAPEEHHGVTFVTDMQAPQADINRTISQFAENRELVANPVWLVRRGSNISIQEWTSRPGGIRFYDGQPPTLETGQSMPNNVIVHLGNMIRYMQDIAGLRDVSTGKNVPGGRSASLAALLKEADDERMSRISKRRRRFWEQIGNLILHTASQYVTEERVIKIAGDDAMPQTITFIGEMLKRGKRGIGASDFDVYIETNDLPQSMTARVEKVEKAIELGILDMQRPADRALAAETMAVGITKKSIDSTKAARRKQHMRNLKMANGEPQQPVWGENMEVMLDEMRSYQQTTMYPELGEQIHALFRQYEDACIGIQALHMPHVQTVAMQAIAKATQAGIIQPPPEPEMEPNEAPEPPGPAPQNSPEA